MSDQQNSAATETTANEGASRANSKPARNVAILIFPGVQIIDFTGPYEVFGQYSSILNHTVYTVAEDEGPITTAMGMSVTPSYTFADCPPTDILIVPGGDVTPQLENAGLIEWLRSQAARAEIVLSVCNGAFFLAKAGLLDGLAATTFYGLLDDLAASAPQTRVVCDQRFVDNGRIITTAGLSSGIDGALHVVSRLHGVGYAQAVALNMEYHWQPASGYARGDFADRKHLRPLFGLLQELGGDLLHTAGGPAAWEVRWITLRTQPAPELAERLARTLAGANQGVLLDGNGSDGQGQRRWRFSDQQGARWQGVASAETVATPTPGVLLTVKISQFDPPGTDLP